MQTDRQTAIQARILVIVHWKISTVDLGKEFDESSPYMNFRRNLVINN